METIIKGLRCTNAFCQVLGNRDVKSFKEIDNDAWDALIEYYTEQRAEDVANVIGVTKQELYKQGVEALEKNFKSPNKAFLTIGEKGEDKKLDRYIFFRKLTLAKNVFEQFKGAKPEELKALFKTSYEEWLSSRIEEFKKILGNNPAPTIKQCEEFRIFCENFQQDIVDEEQLMKVIKMSSIFEDFRKKIDEENIEKQLDKQHNNALLMTERFPGETDAEYNERLVRQAEFQEQERNIYYARRNKNNNNAIDINYINNNNIINDDDFENKCNAYQKFLDNNQSSLSELNDIYHDFIDFRKHNSSITDEEKLVILNSIETGLTEKGIKMFVAELAKLEANNKSLYVPYDKLQPLIKSFATFSKTLKKQGQSNNIVKQINILEQRISILKNGCPELMKPELVVSTFRNFATILTEDKKNTTLLEVIDAYNSFKERVILNQNLKQEEREKAGELITNLDKLIEKKIQK